MLINVTNMCITLASYYKSTDILHQVVLTRCILKFQHKPPLEKCNEMKISFHCWKNATGYHVKKHIAYFKYFCFFILDKFSCMSSVGHLISYQLLLFMYAF